MNIENTSVQENAIAKAEDHLRQGNVDMSIDTLLTALPNNERKVMNFEIQPIILRIFDISVDHLNKAYLKDSIQRYRNLTQRNDLKSLETVTLYLLEKADEKMKKTLAEYNNTSESAESGLTCEEMMLKAVEVEGSQKSQDEVGRCMKFKWEVQKQILESIRQNSLLSKIYDRTTQDAMQFCLDHNRKNEFKIICYLLNQHLDEAKKQGEAPSNIPNPVRILNDNCFMAILNLRMTVIEFAIKMESWSEGFQVAESILEMDSVKQKLTQTLDEKDMSKNGMITEKRLRGMRPKDKAQLYEHMSTIFWRSKYYIMHAASLASMNKQYERKERTPEHKRDIADQIIIATLITPFIQTHADNYSSIGFDLLGKTQQKESFSSLALKGDFSLRTLSRESLLQYIEYNNLMKLASKEVREIHEMMESDEVHPLQMTAQISALLNWSGQSKNLGRYSESLRKNFLIRSLQRLEKIFKTIKYTNFNKFFSYSSRPECERIII